MLVNLVSIRYCTRENFWFSLFFSEMHARKFNLKSLKLAYLTLAALSPRDEVLKTCNNWVASFRKTSHLWKKRVTSLKRVEIRPLVCVLSCFSHVQLFAILWTVAFQAPLYMRFSRQEYWSGLPCLPPGDLPNPGIKPQSIISPALATWEAQGLSQPLITSLNDRVSKKLHCPGKGDIMRLFSFGNLKGNCIPRRYGGDGCFNVSAFILLCFFCFGCAM